MKKLMFPLLVMVPLSSAAIANGIVETHDPRPTEAMACAGIPTVPLGSLHVPEFTFDNDITIRNLDPARNLDIQPGGVQMPASGSRISFAHPTPLVWIEFAQVSAGDVHIIAFIDHLYTELSPGGVDGKTYLITGDAITGFTVQSDINEPRTTEICFVP
jgi:hypothetical protein